MRTLAIECSSFRDTAGLPSVFGKDVAVRGLTEALLQYGAFDRFVLFRQPGLPVGSLEELKACVRPGADLCFESTMRIPNVMNGGGITTWFQPDSSTEPNCYRSLFASRLFPFTNLLHVAGYPSLIRQQFLWLLLDGFAACDSCICTSRALRAVVCDTLEYIAEEMRRHTGAELEFRGRLDVLPLGIDTQRFAPRDKHAIRETLGISPEAFVILWFGRFSVIDKADLLPVLRMYRRLVRANPRRHLLLLLAGNDRRDIPFVPSIREFAVELGIADHVRILENAPADTRHDLFAAADVFTSPVDNLQETFGITPVEAMASGIPQVVSDWDGYRDTVVQGVTGFRIPTYWTDCDGDDQTDYGIGGFGYQGFLWSQSLALDLREYQAAMQRLIDDPSLREAMRVASRKRAVECFDWRVVVRAYQNLWEELSAVAAVLRPQDVPPVPLVSAAMCRRFASFPTAMLEGTEHLTVSDDGMRLLSQDEPFPWHSPAEPALVDAKPLMELLASVAERPGPVQDIATRLTRHPNHRPAVLRMVMWGIKHGLLECRVLQRALTSAVEA